MMPRIPREEYPQRWEKAREILKEMNLDLILAYSDDRFTYGNAYAHYFGDLQTVFEDTLVMLLPDRDPVLLVGPEVLKNEGMVTCLKGFYRMNHRLPPFAQYRNMNGEKKGNTTLQKSNPFYPVH